MCDFDKKKLLTLLNNFKDISDKNIRNDINFFDVAGYPHYENVVSNILSFYFDTNAEHNMKDLWIKSLIKIYNKKEHKKEYAGSIETTGVERETNADNKRIDLLMVANEFLIVIENKIYAGDDYNPFDYYHILAKRRVEENRLNDKNIIEILLSLDDRGNKDDEERGYHFVNIRYDELFDEVKNNIGQYVVDANEKWTIYMNELINNITNLMVDSKMKLDDDLQLLYANNESDIQHFLNVICNDFDEKANFFKSLYKIMCKDFDSIQTYKLSNGLVCDIGGIFVKLKNNIELGVYFNRENHPELIKYGIRETINENSDCKKEIDIIHDKCKNLNFLKEIIKDKSRWKYNIIMQSAFSDTNTNVENISLIFKSMIKSVLES